MAVSQSLMLTESDVVNLDNTSKVRILWKSKQTGESWNGYTRTAKYYVSINGEAETEYSVSYTLPQSSTATIVDKTITVTHKTNGSGSVKVRTWMDTDISAGVVEQTKSLTLTTIPRATTVDTISCTSSYLDGIILYQYTPKSKSYYNYLWLYVRTIGTTGQIIRRTKMGQKPVEALIAGAVKFTEEELAFIYGYRPNASSATIVLVIDTYYDSDYTQKIGQSYKEITLYVPNDVSPTATLTITPVSDVATEEAVYIKGLSKVKFAFSNVVAEGGASVKSYNFYVQDQTVTGTQATFTSGYLTSSGTISVQASIEDSRLHRTFWTKDINVLDYRTPTLDSLTCNTSYINGTITYKYTPACSAFYSRCVISLGDTTIKTISHGKKALAQQTATVTFSASELSTIYNKLPSSTEGKLRFTFRAYSDSAYSNQIGADSYKEITLSIPNIDETQPTASLTLTPVTPLYAPLNALYIKGKSQVKATLSEGAGKYGASIVSYKVSIGGKTENSPYTSDYLTSSGDVTVTGTVTDSRGFSRTYTSTITVMDYAAPRILPASGEDEVIAARCDEAGNLNANGIYLRIKAKREYSRLEQKNLCQIQYRYRADGGTFTAWTTILAADASSDEVDTGAILGTLDVTSSYFVQVRALDYVGEATSTSITISTEKVYWHRAGSRGSFAFGKYAEEDNTFDIAEDKTAIFRGEVRFPGEAWVSRALGTGVAESTVNSGRWGGSGLFYRVCAGGKHIYVAFNCSFAASSSTVRVDANAIPSAYRPPYDVYALCPFGYADGGRGIATVSVSPSGIVNIYSLHRLTGTASGTETVAWIDGYIDFWI